ncbi:MAG TPA: HK97 family phage prohead protease, partial [Clostridia bacterium]|nr:HK97 family phage prohead protease [Clostridia bacterium]
AHGLYKGGFLNAVSVGFVPIRWENGGEDSGFRRKYVEQELLEVSAVAIPANPEALALGLKAGAVQQSDLRDLLELLRATVPSGKAGQTNPLLNFARELRAIMRA